MNLRRATVASLLGLVLLGALFAVSLAQQSEPTFEPADCMFSPLLPWLEDPTVECGYVTVPERRNRGGAPTSGNDRVIRLAVAILRSHADVPAPDPLFVAQGGPGGSTIDTYATLLGYHPIRDQRDIVLFDQRGTLYSQPNLLCSETFAAMDEILGMSEEEALAHLAQISGACRQRLVENEIDLGAYNSLENAADIEDLRIALGYDEINYYGVSYGTLLGLHLMRDYPDHIRSVILDAVVPPQTAFLAEFAQSEERIFSLLFESCRADLACREEYPDLESRFFAMVERLNEEPAVITLTDGETGMKVATDLYGDDVVDFFYQMFYVTGSVGILPAVIADLERGDYRYVETVYSGFLFDRTMSEGMYNSVICSEELGFEPEDANLEGVRAHFAQGAQEELQELIENCDEWNVPQLPSLANEPVSSTIPALLLSGHFDPITPPAYAEAVKTTLPNGYHFVLPYGGHGVGFLVDACIDDIVAAFLADPTSEPRSACLQESAPIDFLADNTITVPLIGSLNGLSRTAWRHAGLGVLLLLAICSALVLWPLGWLLRKILGGERERSPEERKRRWTGRLLIVAFACLAVLFWGGFLLVLSFVVFNESMLLLSALPAVIRPLFLLPFLLALLAALILAVALRQWRRRDDSLLGRLYYSFLAICTIGYIILLYLDGMFGVAF